MKINKSVIYLLTSLIVMESCNAQDKKKSDANIKTQMDSVSYGLGVSIGANLKQNALDSINVDMLSKGMKDFFSNKNSMTAEQSDAAIKGYLGAKEKAKGEGNLKVGQTFLEENKKV